jgi:anti-sigma factor (TIGR02949 family)
MTDCGCDKAKAELEEYLHKEATTTAYADITEHLKTCTDCSEEHLVGLTLMLRVRSACNETAPEELRISVRAMLATTAD